MRSFVDQPGVPLVTFTRRGAGLTASQSRFALLGGAPKPQTWTIPLCLDEAGARHCMLLDGPTAIQAPALGGYLMPNAGGAGYYRFELPPAEWRALIAAMSGLSPGEALAADDSLWASFAAGRAPAADLVAETRALAGNPDAEASVAAGRAWAGFRARGLVEGAALPDYRRFMAAIYAPKLQAIGFDLARGAYASDAPDRQALRQSLVSLLASEAEDPAVNARLAAAAQAYLSNREAALDTAFMGSAFAAHVRAGGVPAAKALVDKALTTEDALVRDSALAAVASTGRTDVATWLLGLQDPRLRPLERVNLVTRLARVAGTRDMAGDWLMANYDRLTQGANGIFVTSRLPSALAQQCSVERSARMDQALGPKVRAVGAGGALDFARTVEAVRHCGVLKTARAAELATALNNASKIT